MHIVYIDDSGDRTYGTFSALIIPAKNWRESLDLLIDMRRDFQRRYGMFVRKEIHARDFVAGRGKVGSRSIPKGLRCEIFREILRTTLELPEAKMINAYYNLKLDAWAFERLINRINRQMEHLDSYATIYSDEGKAPRYTKIARKLRRNNPIPSRFGGWNGVPGSLKDIPATRIIEDPQFIDSSQSLFIQQTDCSAYSLLKRERPFGRVMEYGLNEAFSELEPILIKQANKSDDLGIIRVDYPNTLTPA